MADWRIFAWVHSSSAFRVSATTQDCKLEKGACCQKDSLLHPLLIIRLVEGLWRNSGLHGGRLEVWSTTCNWERGGHYCRERPLPSVTISPTSPSSTLQQSNSPNNSPLSLTLSPRTTLASVGGAVGISVILGRVEPPLSFLLQRNSPGDISSESSLFVWGASGLVFRYWWRAKRKKGRRLFLHIRQSILKRLCSSSRDGLTFTKLFSFPLN